jgi:hypothetical protein
VGKLRARWKEVVRRDITGPRNKRMEVDGQKTEEWKHLLRESRVQKRL